MHLGPQNPLGAFCFLELASSDGRNPAFPKIFELCRLFLLWTRRYTPLQANVMIAAAPGRQHAARRLSVANGTGALASLFGKSHNDRFAGLLSDLAGIGVACAKHFRETNGQDLAGIVTFERQADKIVDEIHELLDNSFIMRFDIPDAMRLTDEVDDVIDGMRRAATHIDIYKPFLSTLRAEAKELVTAGESAICALRDLIAMLSEPRLTLQRARDLARSINEAEYQADDIAARAERGLVQEYASDSANKLEFIALDKLYQLLEEMTDDAKRCGKLVVSLARKEA